MDAAYHAHLSARRVAEPGAGKPVGLHPLDPHAEAIDDGANVSADVDGIGRRDEGVGEIVRAFIFRFETDKVLRSIMIESFKAIRSWLLNLQLQMALH